MLFLFSVRDTSTDRDAWQQKGITAMATATNDIVFGSKEWEAREMAKSRKEPDPLPVTLAEYQALHPLRPKEVDFLAMARELTGTAAERRQTITAYVMIKNPLRIVSVGGEGQHFASLYEDLTQVMRERTALGRETSVSFWPGFTSKELRRHLEKQRAGEAFDRFVIELKKTNPTNKKGD